MEKKGLRKKDVLRMDGLLPPTRRLPVCHAVSSASDKKKDKKWSIGGILRRISSIKDYDSSSNDEEIVYCKRTPRKPAKFNKKIDGVVLHSIENNLEHDQRIRVENNIRHVKDSCRDSLHSRSSDGSLDGLGKKFRKNKLKARAEAKRDHLCVGSSSDEDCHRSNSSLNRFHTDSTQNSQRSNMCNRKTRAARTERYIKRLSRDEGNGSGDTLNELYNQRCSSDYTEDKERVVYADTNGLCRPPIHPRRSAAYSNCRVFPVQKSSVESLRDAERVSLQHPDIRRYSTGQYIMDLNQNNTYGKIARHHSGDVYTDSHRSGNFFTYPAKNACHYSESFDCAVDRRLINPDNQPPEPPPRDPRYRSFGYSSYPMNRHQNVPNYFKQEDNKTTSGISRPNWRNFRSNNKIAWRDTIEFKSENSMSNPKTEFRNSLERINNKYNSSYHCANELAYKEIETTRRRNIRNDQLNRSDANYHVYKARNKSANICETNKHHEAISSHLSMSDWSSGRSPCDQRNLHIITPSTYDVDNCAERSKKEDNRRITPTDETLERRRSSKNLEEALSELEAIYNSLRLGDEDLLDRAERRSMEEFNQKQSKSELDVIAITVDSPDRTKDDMAYRRMHPKERPTSLSDIAGQSTLSSISYLIASPVLSRRDSADDLTRLPAAYSSRRDEPDVTRDDVLFRSINHANNTLRIIDPQPPFGIPLGPVSAATESDYLHTTPTKSEQPRSSYIPQCEPDVVTDDLAYRALRKDVARNVAESKIDVSREQLEAATRSKKRAVRSLSANLYGLISHDRIHLQREHSLDAIKDEIQDVRRNFAATPERPEYFRRVVSDGELSDNDAHRWKELAIKSDIDINGNHPAVGAYRKKLCAYVSSETTAATTTRESPKKEKESGVTELSDVTLSSKAILNDGFWHEYLHSDSNVSAANSIRSTETDFTAYSRLCQDLVNLIKSDDDSASPNVIESPKANDSIVADKSNDFDAKLEINEPSASVRICSLGSHYSGSQIANDERNVESEKTTSPTDSNSTRSSSDSTPAANNLDFYLRVADENVKLIAEAFGNVADHLRDSRLSTLKNLSVSRNSEIEDQSSSMRSSSTPYSQDETMSDDRPIVSPRLEKTVCVASKRNSLMSSEGDQGNISHLEDASTDDMELDLSRAVRDLQLAAASLYEHEKEIEDLGIRYGRIRDATLPFTTAAVTNADESEDNAIRRISLIADNLRQERERDQEETVVLPSGIEARGRDAQSGGSREGLQAFARSQ
ncbi:PREDICTED: uncharacterized protein LOC108761446 [Trachymyrmex cornetzi]|uniref:uncharacterized protein LOC108761446 n=1 Tax=Trachymyrmex cornetzi TaxID=471704 RepID=UPI00084F5EC0|nr:PREDICTED: uncharacterized protein LOC108761446 [Trachymyrmex cornetzi]